MWLPANQTGTDGKTATVEVPIYPDEASIICDGGKGRKTKERKIKLADYVGGFLPLQNVDAAGMLKEYPDMVDLPNLHEPGILFNLKKRHKDEKPYTRTGDIVLALNPFKRYKCLYDEKNRNLYSNMIVWKANGEEDPRKKLEPHVYETSSLTYRGLSFDKQCQSILVSGESGAGKTETVKICMNHMAVVQRGPSKGETGGTEVPDPVVQRVLNSNPLLEAFGNAKTTRNDNSSRFGKYLQLQFHDTDPNALTPNLKETTCILAGSKSDTYLLEKNRITGHDASERSYHVFYYVAAAPDEEKKKVWDVLVGKEETSFKYTGKSPPNTLIDGMTDQDHYLDTQATLQLIDINGDRLIGLWQAIAGVIMCGNITFAEDPKDEERSVVTSPTELNQVAELYGIDPSQLTLACTERTMKTRNDVYKVPQLAGKAKETCDAFAKEIYAKLFDWVVARINDATSAETHYHMKDTVEYGIIGLLDIFGFESFKVNRFEQLCINYANEKLQQKFTEDIFESVQKEYEEEGIDLDEVAYDDNSDVLALVESKQGIMDCLNEACVRPKGDDASFVNGALAANKKNPALIINKMDRMQFGVHHFAGKVMYSGHQFVERNKDAVPSDLEDAMNASSNFLVCLKKDAGAAPTKKPKRSKSVVGQTVWNKYKVQLASLMGNLRKTKSRYIRCVKPNKAKVPEIVEHVSTVEQLRSAGVVAAVTITRSAFPNRLDTGPAAKKFALFWDKEKSPLKVNDGMDEAEKLSAMCNAVFTSALKEREADGKQDFVVGKTKIYFRQGGLEYLELKRSEALSDVATQISRLARGHLGRKNIKKIFFAKEEAERVAREAREEAERVEREAKEAAERAEREEAEREEREAREEAEREEREAREEAEREEREKREAKEAKDREKQAKKEKLLAMKREKEEKKRKEQEEKEAIAELEKRQKQAEAEAKKQEELLKEHEREVGRKEKELVEEEEKVAALQKKYDDLNAEASKLPVKDIEKLQKKADDSDKLVKYLKKENTRMRNETKQMEEDLTKMKETNNRLIEANASAGASLDTLNKQAKILKDHNKKLEKSIDDFKGANKKLDHDLEGRKAYFKAESKIRGDYETVMEKIVKIMEEKCDDSELVEKIMTAQLTCVTNIAKKH